MAAVLSDWRKYRDSLFGCSFYSSRRVDAKYAHGLIEGVGMAGDAEEGSMTLGVHAGSILSESYTYTYIP